jgi:hypothetical protein
MVTRPPWAWLLSFTRVFPVIFSEDDVGATKGRQAAHTGLLHRAGQLQAFLLFAVTNASSVSALISCINAGIVALDDLLAEKAEYADKYNTSRKSKAGTG